MLFLLNPLPITSIDPHNFIGIEDEITDAIYAHAGLANINELVVHFNPLASKYERVFIQGNRME